MAPKEHRLDAPEHAEAKLMPPIVENTKSLPLPNEIVSLIADSAQDLIPLTLVSRQWYHAAQSRLHWRISVSSGASCKHWSRKFNKFPHLASFVRVLELSDPDDDCLGSPYLRSQPAKTLVAALAGVTRLEIVDFVRWGPTEQRFVKSFCNLERLSVGRMPCMSRSKDLPVLVFSFPKLSGLMIYGDVGTKYNPEEAACIIEAGHSLCRHLPSDGKPVRLTEVLSLSTADACHDLLMWVSSPAFDLSKLQLLAMKWSDWPLGISRPATFPARESLCARVGGTLSVLDLGHSNSGGSDIISFHLIASNLLSHFTVLTEIQLDLPDLPYRNRSILHVTVSLLKTITAPCLRIIKLNARSYVPVPSEWQLLDELLVVEAGNVFLDPV
ncbi:hypothetical protein E1B28_003905 [Marasmius oreades]|uniref:F-box domain-containing protein n=1 Tax=Marasmius oreades TaxID=181124 RepID=A0A9P7UXJ4_9AGAR|nr:uncharacterized protein E1B28_003905 [Marasmius oreades]KAG7096473.1 hypothetical protein E1B28_003905 [Marasmius oreades]